MIPIDQSEVDTCLLLTFLRALTIFGHSPKKYYLPIFGVNCFIKIFSLQNFVLYSTHICVCMYAHTIHINKHTHMYMYKHLRLQQRISSGHDKSRHLSLGADSTQPPATDYKHTHTNT